jgi:SAM-dependent methyltransferase
MGLHDSSSITPHASSEKSSISTTKKKSSNIRIKKESSKDVSHLINEFYGGSDFHSVGFWRLNKDNAKTACENLVEELLAFTRAPIEFRPPQPRTDEEARLCVERRLSSLKEGLIEGSEPKRMKGTILNIGCERSATTLCLIKYFPPAAITQITADRKELDACRRDIPGVKSLCMKLPKLKFPANFFDYVICVEGPGRFGRMNLLREALRVLKPEGYLLCSDILYAEKVRRRKIPWTRKDSVQNPENFSTLMLGLGYKDVRVVDATSKCWIPFYEHSTKYFRMKVLSGEIEEEKLKELRENLPGAGIPVSYYVLVSARKAANGEAPSA